MAAFSSYGYTDSTVGAAATYSGDTIILNGGAAVSGSTDTSWRQYYKPVYQRAKATKIPIERDHAAFMGNLVNLVGWVAHCAKVGRLKQEGFEVGYRDGIAQALVLHALTVTAFVAGICQQRRFDKKVVKIRALFKEHMHRLTDEYDAKLYDVRKSAHKQARRSLRDALLCVHVFAKWAREARIHAEADERFGMLELV